MTTATTRDHQATSIDIRMDMVYAIISRKENGWVFAERGDEPVSWEYHETIEEARASLAGRSPVDGDLIAACLLTDRLHVIAWIDAEGEWRAW